MISSVTRNGWASLCLSLLLTVAPALTLAQLNTDSLRTRLANGRVWRLTSAKTTDGNVLPLKSELSLRFEPDAIGIREERFSNNETDTTGRPAEIRSTFQYVVIVHGPESVIKFRNVKGKPGETRWIVTEPKLDASNGYRFRFVGDKKRLRLDSPYRGEGKPTIHYFFDPL